MIKLIIITLLIGGCTTPYGQGHSESDRCEYARYGVLDQHIVYEDRCVEGSGKWGFRW